jgi:(p)ppGpp synthase/HD superfamily hydrolase
MRDYELARDIVERVYRDKKDLAGKPYIDHLHRVAVAVELVAAGWGPDETVALLHDIAEDGLMSLQTVYSIFGPEIGLAVAALTRRNSESYEAYIQRVSINPIAVNVKLADLADNMDPERMALLPEEKRNKLMARYVAAVEVLNQA